VRRRKFTISTVFLAILIYACSYLSWGSFQVSFYPGNLTSQYFPYIGHEPTVVLNGWNGTLKLFGIELSNWYVPAAAVSLVVLAVLRGMSIFDRRALISMVLSFYGALHTGHVVYVLFESGKLGMGAVLSAAFFVMIAIVLLKEMRNVGKTGKSGKTVKTQPST